MLDPYTLEQCEEDVARLRGQVDRLTEVLGTGTALQINGTLTATDPVNGGPETWHTLGTLAHFTLSRARFQLTPAGRLEIDFQGLADGANLTTVVFSVTMPAAYRPAQVRRATCETGRAVTAADPWPRLTVNTDGTVQIDTQPSIAVTLECNVSFPLD